MTEARPWRTASGTFAQDTATVAQWLAAHRANVEASEVWSSCSPGDLLTALPRHLPTDVCDVKAMLGELEQFVVPGLVRWDAPGWFAWFPSNGHPHSLLGDLLGAALGQQGMLWMSSPACTEVEMRTLEWLRQAIGLPECFAEGGLGGGVIQDTASSAVLSCLVAARDRATDGRAREQGMQAVGRLTVYASTEAHSSVLKAVHLAGIGRAQFRAVAVDAHHAMDATALRQMIEADVADGCTPIFCCATVGTTASGAFDPVNEIAQVCTDHALWLHVDAAWAGTAALCETFRAPIMAGADHADSWCFNPHKWMGVNFDCSCLWLANRRPLIEAMSITPEYLRNDLTDSGQVVDYRDWHVQLGRRFRALKLWLLLRCTGVQALGAMVEHHVSLATWLATQVSDSDAFELAAPRSLGLVCLRHVDGDDATQLALDTINADGRFAATHCRLHDQLVIRIAIGTLDVEHAHVEALWSLLSASSPS